MQKTSRQQLKIGTLDDRAASSRSTEDGVCRREAAFAVHLESFGLYLLSLYTFLKTWGDNPGQLMVKHTTHNA
jgi:hypothetical protein